MCRKRKGKGRKGTERKGKERKGREGEGREGKGKERNGQERNRKGKCSVSLAVYLCTKVAFALSGAEMRTLF